MTLFQIDLKFLIHIRIYTWGLYLIMTLVTSSNANSFEIENPLRPNVRFENNKVPSSLLNGAFICSKRPYLPLWKSRSYRLLILIEVVSLNSARLYSKLVQQNTNAEHGHSLVNIRDYFSQEKHNSMILYEVYPMRLGQWMPLSQQVGRRLVSRSKSFIRIGTSIIFGCPFLDQQQDEFQNV